MALLVGLNLIRPHDGSSEKFAAFQESIPLEKAESHSRINDTSSEIWTTTRRALNLHRPCTGQQSYETASKANPPQTLCQALRLVKCKRIFNGKNRPRTRLFSRFKPRILHSDLPQGDSPPCLLQSDHVTKMFPSPIRTLTRLTRPKQAVTETPFEKGGLSTGFCDTRDTPPQCPASTKEKAPDEGHLARPG